MKLPDFLRPKQVVLALALLVVGLGAVYEISAHKTGATLPPPPCPDGYYVNIAGNCAPRHATKSIEEKSSIPFETENQDDSSLPAGQTKISQYGFFGEKTKVWEVSYVDGRETSRKVVSDEVTTKPTPKIVRHGTGPVEPPGDPTALCMDGTYSYSQHARGTCSHHGGVAQWINYPY